MAVSLSSGTGTFGSVALRVCPAHDQDTHKHTGRFVQLVGSTRLVFLVQRRARIIPVTVPVHDLALTVMGEDLPALPSRGLSSCVVCSFLGVVERTDSLGALSNVRPFILVWDNMDVFSRSHCRPPCD